MPFCYAGAFGINMNGEDLVLQWKHLPLNRFVKGKITAELIVIRNKSASGYCRTQEI